MSGKKIKIALCISGEPRNTMFSFPYIYESILKYKDTFDIDVYIHTFEGFRALELYTPKKYIIDSTSELDIWAHYIPFLSDLGLTFHSQHTLPIKNTLLMNYGNQKCYELTQNESYDYYIRMRPDILFPISFSLKHKISILENTDFDIILPFSDRDLSDPQFKNVANDQFAIGKEKAMKEYFNLLPNLISLVKETGSYWPEKLLGYYLNSKNIKIFEDDLNPYLIRKINPLTFPINNNFISQ